MIRRKSNILTRLNVNRSFHIVLFRQHSLLAFFSILIYRDRNLSYLQLIKSYLIE